MTAAYVTSSTKIRLVAYWCSQTSSVSPLCQPRSCSQQLHPLTARPPIPANNAASVVLLTSSFRRLLRYFCLTALASSSVNDASPLWVPLFLLVKYSSENFRPSSSICVGVRRGLRPPRSWPSVSRRPLCGRSGGGGSAFTKLYPSSSASVPLSLGDCDRDDVFLRFLPSASVIVRLGGPGRLLVAPEEGDNRSGEGFRISFLWRRYGCGERRNSSSVSTSEDVGASSRTSGGSTSCGMLSYLSFESHNVLGTTGIVVRLMILIGDACACAGVVRLPGSCAVVAIVELLGFRLDRASAIATGMKVGRREYADIMARDSNGA